MVSPKPLSDFVPDVTLIAFPIPSAVRPARRQIKLYRESTLFAPKKVLVWLALLHVGSASRRQPEIRPWLDLTRGVLDGCSQPRNQGSHQNFLID
jgi:hypothetical protein